MTSSTSSIALRRIGLTLAIATAMSGCATSSNPKDPLEGFNRAMFKFNDTVDKAALKPAATVYKAVLPSFVQTGVGNFFGNLADIWSAANNLMQGKGAAGMSDITRVTLNSTFGIFGLLDIASEAGLTKHNEDFGQTLGYWGVQPGPYLMLPLLGPSTFRDTVALPLDIAADPWQYKEPIYLRNIGSVTRLVDKRAYLLDASNLMEEAALDRYEFVRDGFLQQRESKIRDGESGPRKAQPLSEQDGEGAPAAAAPAVAAPAVSSEATARELSKQAPAAADTSQ
ncbi:phospholipid-binding lipoprotein MlaA [Oxalobacteraceae bacterium GrIS 1.11]